MNKIWSHEGRLGNRIIDSNRTQSLETPLRLMHDTIRAQCLNYIVPVHLIRKQNKGLWRVVSCTKPYERKLPSNEFQVQHVPRYKYLIYVNGNGKYHTLNLPLLQQTNDRVLSNLL